MKDCVSAPGELLVNKVRNKVKTNTDCPRRALRPVGLLVVLVHFVWLFGVKLLTHVL